MPLIFNHPILKPRRKELRKNQTEAEKLLWFRLRNQRLNNLRFIRQYSIGRFILDFYCPEHRLGIELDGGGHTSDEAQAYDKERTHYLQSKNVRILRFWNHEVLKNLKSVLEKIVGECLPGS